MKINHDDGEDNFFTETLSNAMWLPQIPNQALEFMSDLLQPICQWKKLHATSVIAGLMTDARYQVNAIRLDWLQRLILSKSTGKIKPNKTAIESILNTGFEMARVTRLEDPIEDFFCDVVPTSRGDFLIFDGHWEHAAEYTDTLIQAFEKIPETPVTKEALDTVYSILRLSDALAKRANVARFEFKASEPWGRIKLPSNEHLKSLSSIVRFTDKDLEKIGVSQIALKPFFLDKQLHQYIGSSLPGDSPLEFYPLISIPDGILVAHPGTISLAARALLLLTAKRRGFENALCRYLERVQESYSEWTNFWPTRAIHLTESSKDGLRRSVCKFAPGRFQHVIQLPVSVKNFPKISFGQFVNVDKQTTRAIQQDIEHFWLFLEAQEDYREAITIVLMGGWGGGYAFDLGLDKSKGPKGWTYLPLSFADMAQLGSCEDGKLHNLCRIIAQVKLLEGLGYIISNVNGTMNLYGNWRATNGLFIPEHMVDIGPPNNIMLPIDDLFEPRREAAQNRDLRTLPFPDDLFKRVQRIDWGPDEDLKPIYASLEDIASHRLMGAISVGDQVWWIEAIPNTLKSDSSEWQYQVWNAAMQWIAAVAQQILSDFSQSLPKSPQYVGIVVEDADQSQSKVSSQNIDAFQHIKCVTDADGTRMILLGKKWSDMLWQTENCAELALAVSVLEQLLISVESRASREALLESIRRAIPSVDWRWIHAVEARSLIERMAFGGLVSEFHEIPLSASVLVTCGSVWRFHDRSKGYEFLGEEECRDFLTAYYDFILDELITHIKKFNRAQLVVASAERYQAARNAQRIWRTSIRALRSIRGKAADKAAFDRQNAMNAVKRASKVICEIAACEATETGGLLACHEDLDEMYARALLLFGNGQLYSTIRAGIVPPHLKISPAGDLMSDRSVFEKTLVPAANKFNQKTLNQGVDEYVRRKADHEPHQQKGLPWSDDFRDAVENEFLAPAEAVVDFSFALLQLAESRNEGVFCLQQSEIVSWLSKCKAYPQCDVNAMLERLTLRRRDSWKKEENWLKSRDLDLSRFDRPNSLINRPLLALSDEADPIVLIAPMLIDDALMYALGNLQDGTLHNEFWSSSEARKYAGKRADQLGREFEDEINKRLNLLGFIASARRSVSDLLKQTTEADMGDVDVFAISADHSTVWIIEAKNLRFCRTESEIASRMTEYKGVMRLNRNGKEKPDKMLRHLNRVRYLKKHSALLGERFQLPSKPVVRGLMVVDAPQPMNFHMLEQDPDAGSCMLDELEAIVRQS